MWDTAQSLEENASYSACLVFNTDTRNHYLVDAWRGHVDFRDLEEIAVAMAKKHRPDAIIIENAGIGGALLSVLSDRGVDALGIPTPRASKVDRLNAHLVKLRSGSVRICDGIGDLNAFFYGIAGVSERAI